jgi:hypothetical protein
MASWRAALPADPLEWLLEPGDPAVRHLALRQLLIVPLMILTWRPAVARR